MKKSLSVFAIFAAICALGFSERFWCFESGSRDLDGKVFGRISVINKTGEEIDVSGEPLENDSKGLYFEDSILISGRTGNCDYCDAVYSIDDKHLQVVICPRGSYDLDSQTYILPPMRTARRNPPPRHHRRAGHGPAPRRMESRRAPRHHDEQYEWHHGCAINQNGKHLDFPRENPRRPNRMR